MPVFGAGQEGVSRTSGRGSRPTRARRQRGRRQRQDGPNASWTQTLEGHIARLVAGIPPQDLGDGGLRTSLERLAAGNPVRTTLVMDHHAVAERQGETVLFYVCSEALANAIKHADAQVVMIDVGRAGDTLEMRVSDDGRATKPVTRSRAIGAARRRSVPERGQSVAWNLGIGLG